MVELTRAHDISLKLLLSSLFLCACSKKPVKPVQVGSLSIFSFPSSARIYLDGTDTGKLTPSTVSDVAAGSHSIRLQLFTYFDTAFSAEVLTSQNTYLEITLTRRPLVERQLTSGLGQSQNSSWSPDGLKIAFDANRDGTWKIYSMDSSGEAHGLTTLTTSLTDCHFPDWSPDGSSIAFESSGDIWTMGSLGQSFGSSQLTTDPAPDLSPSWSPNTEEIAFFSTRFGQAIWVTSSQGEGSGLFRLTEPAQPSKDPDWSPDGNQILYSRFFEDNWDLWTIDLRLHPYMPYRLTRDPADDLLPSFSPDGSKIAFFSNRDEDSSIWVIDSRGEDYGLVKVISPVEPFKPNWSPDGSKINFCRHDDIWVITGLK